MRRPQNLKKSTNLFWNYSILPNKRVYTSIWEYRVLLILLNMGAPWGIPGGFLFGPLSWILAPVLQFDTPLDFQALQQHPCYLVDQVGQLKLFFLKWCPIFDCSALSIKKKKLFNELIFGLKSIYLGLYNIYCKLFNPQIS